MAVPVLLMAHSLGEGGSERQLIQTATGLAGGRFQPHVVSVAGGFGEEVLRRADIPVWRLPLRSFADWSAVSSARRLRRYIRQHSIRLVHPFDYTLTLFGVFATQFRPGVITLASQRCFFDVVPAKYRSLLRLALRVADGVVVNSRALGEHLCQLRAAAPERIHVCHNGVDTERFRPGPRRRLPELRDAGVVVGTVAVLRPEKNLGLLLRAFADLLAERPDLRLLIAGGGPEREALERQSAQLGIAPSVLFHPPVADVAPLLGSIDVFVHPSLSEGFPNAVMEAMASGCCVVVTDVGGCTELVTHERTGLLFRNNDLAELTNQLRRAIARDGLRHALGEAAARHIREHFSLERMVRRMEQIYQMHLENRHTAPDRLR
ncbi:MAG: glycosyltransferase family 4 protein [Bryobacteraceae bacterium]|jgi:glycosyltransferase involved in cell wall biosynthesis|nr:glycosyltransferase family 4 protein [Bryobacteraceae bacterium]